MYFKIYKKKQNVCNKGVFVSLTKVCIIPYRTVRLSLKILLSRFMSGSIRLDQNGDRFKICQSQTGCIIFISGKTLTTLLQPDCDIAWCSDLETPGTK